MTILLSLLGEFWPLIAGAVAAVAGALFFRKSGKNAAENKAMKDSQKRQEKGRDAVSDLRGATRDERIKRLRDNDKQW